MRARASTLLAALALTGVALSIGLPRLGGGSTVGPTNVTPPSTPSSLAFAALVDDAGSGRLPAQERAELVARLRAMGPTALARFLDESVAKDAGETPRLVALECLYGCSTARQVALLVRLASPETAPTDALRAALRAAIVHTLERDPRAEDELAPAWRASEPLREELIAAVGERGQPAGLEFLAWAAEQQEEHLERAVAEGCLRIAPRARGLDEREQLERLSVLLESTDLACVQTMAAALARAQFDSAVPALIDLLASDSRGVRERAQRSLQELTGMALGATPQRWQAWLETERAWLEREAPAVLADLGSDDDARVLAALRTISSRRLQRDDLAASVVDMLVHGNAAVRAAACATLGALGSGVATEALIDCLEDEDDAVLQAAWSALRQLTGLELPADADLWRQSIADVG